MHHYYRKDDIIVKQLVLSSSGQDMMNKEALMSVLSFKKSIENDLNIQDFCYRHSNNTSCFIKSPLVYWNDDMETLKRDSDVKSTILRHPYRQYFLINKQNNYADRIVLSYAFKASEYDRVDRWETSIQLGQHFIYQKYTNLRRKLFQVKKKNASYILYTILIMMIACKYH